MRRNFHYVNNVNLSDKFQGGTVSLCRAVIRTPIRTHTTLEWYDKDICIRDEPCRRTATFIKESLSLALHEPFLADGGIIRTRPWHAAFHDHSHCGRRRGRRITLLSFAKDTQSRAWTNEVAVQTHAWQLAAGQDNRPGLHGPSQTRPQSHHWRTGTRTVPSKTS